MSLKERLQLEEAEGEALLSKRRFHVKDESSNEVENENDSTLDDEVTKSQLN